jgi:galactokinase/mevalonate kinase-like predicted kinase
MRAGATGGKLLGAGGGGFLLFYVPSEEAKKSVRARPFRGPQGDAVRARPGGLLDHLHGVKR